uniref:SH3 domain-containing protein n=1 Tax=Bursaphelenchus xylophilus TaxID=6326 RepID=A0A1I7SQW6_BURXY
MFDFKVKGFADAKNMFESLNKSFNSQNVKSGLTKLANNPLAQKAAVTLAKNDQVRSVAINQAAKQATGKKADPFAEKIAHGAILNMVNEFENKPIMGRPADNPQLSKPAPPPKPQPAYKTLTAIDPFEYPPVVPSASDPRPPSYGWNTNSDGGSKKPARPPPPRASQNSTPTEFNSGWGSTSAPSFSSSNPSYGSRTTEPHAVVRYPYKAAHSDELSCEPNDTVILKNAVDDQWVQGLNTRTGESGIVPLNFLDIMVPLAPASNGFSASAGYGNSSSGYGGSSTATSPSGDKAVVRALYDYHSDVEGDLNFNAGDTIAVLEQCNAEWLRGQLKNKFGIFPITFVEFLTGGPQTSDSSLYKVQALYDYVSSVAEDLNFKAHDVIDVVEEQGPEWVKGRLNGQIGLVPLTYVQKI